MRTKDEILNEIVAKEQAKDAEAERQAQQKADDAKAVAAKLAAKAKAMGHLPADTTIEEGLVKALAGVRERLQVGAFLPNGDPIRGTNPREAEETLLMAFVAEFVERVRSGEV
jgi:hypothetical protein